MTDTLANPTKVLLSSQSSNKINMPIYSKIWIYAW